MDQELKTIVISIAITALLFTGLGYILMKEHNQFMSECMADGLKRYQCKALSEGHTSYINIVRTK